MRWIGLTIFVLLIQGCASYGKQTEQVFNLVEQGQWDQAESALADNLDKDDKDRLLYRLELGTLKHLQGDFEASNRQLEQAKQLAEVLYTTSVSEEFKVLLTNPRQRVYRAQDFERLFIEYLQTLNYIALAENADSSAPLQQARIMGRQIEIILDDLAAQRDSYQQMRDKQDSFSARLMSVFRALNGDVFDRSAYELRDDAWLRYLTGLVYEQLGELNEARVAYQQAAELYEQGYAQQYGLDETIQHQAWFDTLRIMKQQGVWQNEWPQLAQQKLAPEWQQKLESWSQDMAELVVIDHQGWIPKREEMNAVLLVNEQTRNMEVYPIVTGEGEQALAQQIWFYLMYTDKGLGRLALNVYQDDLRGYIRGSFSKTLYLAPIWNEVQALGLDQAAKTPLRVTIPYYNLLDLYRPAALSLQMNNQGSETLILAESPAMMAVQSQLVAANEDFYAALARAMIKRRSVQQVTQGNDLLRFVGDLATSATEAAETRNWQTLPANISIGRYWLTPGEFQAQLSDGRHVVTRLNAGEKYIWLVSRKAGQLTSLNVELQSVSNRGETK